MAHRLRAALHQGSLDRLAGIPTARDLEPARRRAAGVDRGWLGGAWIRGGPGAWRHPRSPVWLAFWSWCWQRPTWRGQPTEATVDSPPDTSGVSAHVRVGLLSLSLAILMNVDILVVRHFFDDASAALYSASAVVGRIVLFASLPAAQVVLPHIIRQAATGEPLSRTFRGHGPRSPFSSVVARRWLSSSRPRWFFQIIVGAGYTPDLPLVWAYTVAGSLLALLTLLTNFHIGAGTLRVMGRAGAAEHRVRGHAVGSPRQSHLGGVDARHLPGRRCARHAWLGRQSAPKGSRTRGAAGRGPRSRTRAPKHVTHLRGGWPWLAWRTSLRCLTGGR